MKAINLFVDFEFTSLSPDAQDEEWMWLKDYNGKYAVSNKGRVVSFSYKTPIILKPNISNSGYYYVGLSKNNKKKYCWVHRLIASCFIVDFDGKKIINHIDGNKLNNNTSNLECVTYKENSQHAFRLGLTHPTNGGVFIRVDQFSKSGVYIKSFNSMLEASKTMNTTMPNIRGAIFGLNGQKTACGFVWRKSECQTSQGNERNL